MRLATHIIGYPVVPCLPHLNQLIDESTPVLSIMGDIVRIQTSAEKINGEPRDKISQRDDPAFFFFIKTSPVSQMFFRPEEMHRTSGEGHVFHPFQDRNRHVAYQSSGISVLEFAILHCHLNRFAAIETDRIDLDCFTREKPADR